MSVRKTAVRPAIIIMSRMPVPGEVKTRMQPLITPERCAELHRDMLLDTIEMTAKIKSADTFLFLAPVNGQTLPIQIDIPDEKIFGQTGKDLGERIFNSVLNVYEQGYEPVTVIGGDCPWMQPEILEEAIDSLWFVDVCIAPARDGGYCLIGIKRPLPGLFSGIHWGTGKVFDDTIEKAGEAGLKTRILKEQHDLDDVSSLREVAIDLERMTGADPDYFPHRTYTWILDQLLL